VWPTGLFVCLERHVLRHRVTVGLDVALRQQLTQVVGAAVPLGQASPGLFLLFVVIDRRQHHQAFQADVIRPELVHQLGRHACQLHAALDHQGCDAKGRCHRLDGLALAQQARESKVLVGGMHGHVKDVLGQAGHQRLVSRHDEDGHRVVVGDIAVAHQQVQRLQATATGAHFKQATRALDDDQVLQHAAVQDGRGQLGDAHLAGAAAWAHLMVCRQHQLVQGGCGAGGCRDHGIDLCLGEFHEGLLHG